MPLIRLVQVTGMPRPFHDQHSVVGQLLQVLKAGGAHGVLVSIYNESRSLRGRKGDRVRDLSHQPTLQRLASGLATTLVFSCPLEEEREADPAGGDMALYFPQNTVYTEVGISDSPSQPKGVSAETIPLVTQLPHEDGPGMDPALLLRYHLRVTFTRTRMHAVPSHGRSQQH